MDEFTQYLIESFGDASDIHIYASGGEYDMRVFAHRHKSKIVELLGLSVFFRVDPSLHNDVSEVLAKMANRLNVPFLIIDERNADWKNNSGHLNVTVKSLVKGSQNCCSKSVPVSKFEEFLQDCFGTDYKELGTNKQSHAPPTPFRGWGRKYLPTDYIPVDIDIIVTDKNNIPKVLLEIKRTKKLPLKKWNPFPEDWRQYFVYYTICKNASMEFIVINQEIGTPISDSSQIGWYKITSVRPKDSSNPYEYEKELMTAKEAKNRIINLVLKSGGNNNPPVSFIQ